MRITPILQNPKQKTSDFYKEPAFGHGEEAFWKSDYSTKDKFIVAGTTALGVASSLAILAKAQGRSLKPKSFLNYLKKIYSLISL